MCNLKKLILQGPKLKLIYFIRTKIKIFSLMGLAKKNILKFKGMKKYFFLQNKKLLIFIEIKNIFKPLSKLNCDNF